MSDITVKNDNQVNLIDDREIPCMLLPVKGEYLLVPTVSVAEMAPVRPLDDVPQTPDWLFGMYEWRGMKIPVISLETLNGGGHQELNRQGRIAVLNNTGVNDKLQFIAIHTQGIPRMSRVGPKDIVENESLDKRPFDLMAVKIGVEGFRIPDISAIESAYSELNVDV